MPSLPEKPSLLESVRFANCDHDKNAALICASNLRNSRLLTSPLKFKIDRFIQNYFFSLNGSNFVPSDMADICIIPIKHS